MAVETFVATIKRNDPSIGDIKIIIAKEQNFIICEDENADKITIEDLLDGNSKVTFEDTTPFLFQVDKDGNLSDEAAEYYKIKKKLNEGDLVFPDSPTTHQNFGGMVCQEVGDKIKFV